MAIQKLSSLRSKLSSDTSQTDSFIAGDSSWKYPELPQVFTSLSQFVFDQNSPTQFKVTLQQIHNTTSYELKLNFTGQVWENCIAESYTISALVACDKLYACSVIHNFTENPTVPAQIYFRNHMSSETYALLITDKGEFRDGVLTFTNPERPVPRVIWGSFFRGAPGGKIIEIPPLMGIKESGYLSYHIIKLRAGDQKIIAGYSQVFYGFPINTSPTTTSQLPNLSSDMALPFGVGSYKTIIFQYFLKTNAIDNFYCDFQIKFRGIISNFYINGESLGLDTSGSLDQTQTFVFSKKAYFQKDQNLTVITLNGYNLSNFLLFRTCTYYNGTSVSAGAFSNQEFLGTKYKTFDFYFSGNATLCNPNCHSCLRYDYCLICKPDYWLSNGTCFSICTGPTYTIPTALGQCASEVSKTAVGVYKPVFDNSTKILSLSYRFHRMPKNPILILSSVVSVKHGNSLRPSPSSSSSKVLLPEDLNYKYTLTAAPPTLTFNKTITPVNDVGINENMPILIYETRKNSLLHSVFQESAELVNAEEIYYYFINDTILLKENMINTVYFFADCPTGCRLAVTMSGNLLLKVNQRLKIVNTFFGIEQTYSPSRIFQGLNSFLLQITNSAKVKIKILGGYTIYAPEYLLLKDTVSVSPLKVIQENCRGQGLTGCVMCSNYYFLNTKNNSCVQQCPNDTIVLPSENLCQESCPEWLFLYSNICGKNCGEGKYLNSEDECVLCPTQCSSCRGPAPTDCIECAFPWVRSGSSCVCPSGYELDEDTMRCTEKKDQPEPEPSVAESTMSTTVKTLAISSSVALIAGADPTLIWGLVNLLQMFYYLMFFNVKYPLNLQRFFEIFSLGRLTFLPSFDGFFPSDQPKLKSPPNFYDNDFTGFLLGTAGSMFLLILVNLLIYAACKILFQFQNRLPSLMKGLIIKGINYYEWSVLIRIWISAYFELTMASLLQIMTLNFTTPIFAVSSITSLLTFLMNMALPVMSYLILSKINNRTNVDKYQCLVEDYDVNDPKKKYFMVMIIAQRLFKSMFIVLLYYTPLLQITFVWIVNLSLALLTIVRRPHHRTVNNFLDIFNEIGFLAIHSMILILAYDDFVDDLSDKQRENIAVFVIGVCFLMMGVEFIVIIKEQFETYQSLYRFIKRLLLKQKGINLKKSKKKFPRKRKVRRAKTRVKETL